MSVVLVGLPGAGKSTVGALLAAELGLDFVDVDRHIEAAQGRTVAAIFAAEGEAAFRALEEQATLTLLEQNQVLALGGGAVTNPRIREALGAHQVVWLTVSPEDAHQRVGRGDTRPLLADDPLTRLRALAEERTALYAAVASHTADTQGHSPRQVAARLARQLRTSGGAQRVSVQTASPYEVLIGPGVLQHLSDAVGAAQRVAVIHSRPELAEEVVRALPGYEVTLVRVPDAEAGKTPSVLVECWNQLAAAGFTRSDRVVGIGGGAVTDLAGFVAATWLRGVGFVSVPTTVLGMVDAAVGGKTGINLEAGKNLVGAFHEPRAVLADVDLLRSLPGDEVSAGMAEVVKCGFISDPVILQLVADDVEDACQPGSERFTELVRRSVQVKADVVAADLTERTSSGTRVGRERLNYGHTLGHAVEAREGFRLRHGQAISIGMVWIAEVSRRLLGLPDEVAAQHAALLGELGLPTSYEAEAWPELRQLMSLDKKARGSRLRLVGLAAPGEVVILDDPDEQALSESYAAFC